MCKCLGYFQYKDWDFNYETDLPSEWADGSIKILYRDRIKVFYSTVGQAKQAGYTEFSETVFSDNFGFLYSYTGLRGDAKRMYTSIKKGTEKRVQLIKAQTVAAQSEWIKDADLVIWACGY